MRVNPGLIALLIIAALSCSKSKSASVQPQALHPDISKIAGTHLWSGTTINEIYDATLHQFYADTSAYSFSADIVIVNDSTIYGTNHSAYIHGLPLHYVNTDNTLCTVTFTGYDSDKYGSYQTDSIVYNYATNTIIWEERSNISSYKPNSLAGSFLVHTP